jgi:3-carboxy-cis,cis-muconate cycloisomerase
MPVRLIECVVSTDEMAEIFSDRSVLDAMLRFEVGLARAQARLGLIPAGAAESIAIAANPEQFDGSLIAREARASATPVVALVDMLTARVHTISPNDAVFVHRGATSQDVADTALVLLLRRAGDALARDHERLTGALRALSERHAGAVMVARTLLQPAQPTTFGYKIAGSLASIERSWNAARAAIVDAVQLQFGGPAGTLSAYAHGLALAEALGRELGLPVPPAPWHTHRDRLAAAVASCGIYGGSLGKLARDLALLMQFEVAEVSEPGGRSSSMPHKRNPAGAVVAQASVARIPGLVGTYLSLMVQEHERAAGNWQAEWQTVADVVTATGSALAAVADAVDHLEVHADRMRANLELALSDATPDANVGAAESLRRRLLDEGAR